MTDKIIEKTIFALEFNKIRLMLTEQAVSEKAKNRAQSLTPIYDKNQIENDINLTDEALVLLYKKGAPSFCSAENIPQIIKRADIGSQLTAGELLSVAKLLRVARLLKDYKEENDEKSKINVYFQNLSANKYLEELISVSISPDLEITDSASDELHRIRRKIKSQAEKIRELLQKIIHSKTYQKFLQEPIITSRSDRFVVPVKAEYKNEIRGLIHDTSASGATVFIEPMTVVEANNELKILFSREKDEIERILYALSEQVSTFSENILNDYEIVTELDFIFAKAKLAKIQNATKPIINEQGIISLRKARHPLIDKKVVVPIDIALGEEFSTLVITGPNTGGKTVTLKTVGLLTLMMQSGLLISADEGSKISIFHNIFADIGDEQSIEQSLSTFSSHLKNIITITENVDNRSLVLLDELGAGTDPIEGASLAISILEYIKGFGARAIATTHYFELKTYALETENVQNASCEFDTETLKPTYRLIIGAFGRSNAFNIALKLGLSEHIIAKADEFISKEHKNIDTVLGEMEQAKLVLEREIIEASEAKAILTQKKDEYLQKLENLEKEKEEFIENKDTEYAKLIETAKEHILSLTKELEQIKKDKDEEKLEKLSLIKKNTNEVLNKITKNKPAPVEKATENIEVQIGDIVTINSINKKATVLTLPDKDNNLTVLAGQIKTTLKLKELTKVQTQKQKQATNNSSYTMQKTARQGSLELDLRGMMALDAEVELDRFIDNALIAGISNVTIIHGKGTGVLRKMVHSYLKSSSSVRTFRLGVFGEGEMGVTIVELK